MGAFKEKNNGKWYVQFRYTDWQGKRQQKLKRGFSTRHEALKWEREFLFQKQADVTMSFASLYESLDGGIAWRTRSYLPLPNGLNSTDGVFAVASDTDNYLWIVCGGSGQVWRGRLNRLGWKNEQTSFTK